VNKSKIVASDAIYMSVPLPHDIRAWIAEKAKTNLAPMSSTIIIALRAQMLAESGEKRTIG
jgi:hypothetical protein